MFQQVIMALQYCHAMGPGGALQALLVDVPSTASQPVSMHSKRTMLSAPGCAGLGLAASLGIACMYTECSAAPAHLPL